MDNLGLHHHISGLHSDRRTAERCAWTSLDCDGMLRCIHCHVGGGWMCSDHDPAIRFPCSAGRGCGGDVRHGDDCPARDQSNIAASSTIFVDRNSCRYRKCSWAYLGRRHNTGLDVAMVGLRDIASSLAYHIADSLTGSSSSMRQSPLSDLQPFWWLVLRSYVGKSSRDKD